MSNEIPGELKIPRPDWPDAAEFARDIAKEIISPRSGHEIIDKTEVLPERPAKVLLSIATNAWRIRTRLTDSTTREPREEMGTDDLKKVVRYLDSMFESLSGIGMEVKDRTGEAFDYGLPEKVVAAQPQAGLSKEIVLETLRPTIYFGRQIAQQGEVVIGTPLILEKNQQ